MPKLSWPSMIGGVKFDRQVPGAFCKLDAGERRAQLDFKGLPVPGLVQSSAETLGRMT